MVKKNLEFDSKIFPFPLTPVEIHIDRRGLISRLTHVLTSQCYSFTYFFKDYRVDTTDKQDI